MHNYIYIYFLFFGNKKNAHNVITFNNGLGEIKLG